MGNLVGVWHSSYLKVFSVGSEVQVVFYNRRNAVQEQRLRGCGNARDS